MRKHHVLLVPGFFGFGSLGAISYFAGGVRQLLEQAFERAGVSVQVTEVATLPTASIRVRAARVREALAAIAASGDDLIHIIGHSTGGLDARLAIAPTASLPVRTKFEDYGRVRSVVTVCCAHFGSPVATFFSGWMGRRLLRVGARYLAWAFERGRVPLSWAFRLGYWLLWLWRPFQRQPNAFDELFAKLINDLSNERRIELVQFLRAVSSEEDLVFQLTPAGCDLLNACTAEPAVRYGSVVARSSRPTWRTFFSSFGDPYAQLVYPLYAFLYRLAARPDARWIPEAVGSQRARLLDFWGELPSPRDNDGISPTNSQIWGELVHAASADHLDVVGHFGAAERSQSGAAERSQSGAAERRQSGAAERRQGGAAERRQSGAAERRQSGAAERRQSGAAETDGHSGDWLPSHSGFGVAQFERLWSDVASFLLVDALPGTPPPSEPGAGRERTEQDLPNARDPAP